MKPLVSTKQLNAHKGTLDERSVVGSYTCTTCGYGIDMYLQVKAGTIAQARAYSDASDGCDSCQKCAAAVAAMAEGLRPEDAARIDLDTVRHVAVSLRCGDMDGPLFALAALKLAVRNWLALESEKAYA